MMQVVFPTYEMPIPKVNPKPNTSFLYRFAPKLDRGVDVKGLESISLMFSRMKDSQKSAPFTCTDNGYSLIDVCNEGNAERPLLNRWSNSVDALYRSPHRSSIIRDKLIHFSSERNKWQRQSFISDAQMRKRPLGNPPVLSMSYKRFPDPGDDHLLHDNPSHQRQTFKNSEMPNGHLVPHSMLTQHSPVNTSHSVISQAWSKGMEIPGMTKTAKMCSGSPPQSMAKDILTRPNNIAVSNKTDCTSSSDMSTPAPVKGILKSCRQSSRSPSLEDEENSGKSFSSQGSKKRVKFLEIDTISPLPSEPNGHNFNERMTFDKDIVDGYNPTTVFSSAQNYNVIDNDNITKAHTLHNKGPIPKCTGKQKVVSTEDINDHNSCSDKNTIHSILGHLKQSRLSHGVNKHGRTFSDKCLNDLNGSHFSSGTPISKGHLDTKSDIANHGVGLKSSKKFASMPRGPKSRQSVSPWQFCAPINVSDQPTSSKIFMPPNVQTSRKNYRKNMFSPAQSEKENNELMESGSWLSLKGSKKKAKSHGTKSKQQKQGGNNFCSEEKTMQIMEWLDTVNSQRGKKPSSLSKLISVK